MQQQPEQPLMEAPARQVFGTKAPVETVPPPPTTICWVAREVYGADNPLWLEFRAWMLADAPDWLHASYLRRGEGWAQWLSSHAWLKPAVRAVMNAILWLQRR